MIEGSKHRLQILCLEAEDGLLGRLGSHSVGHEDRYNGCPVGDFEWRLMSSSFSEFSLSFAFPFSLSLIFPLSLPCSFPVLGTFGVGFSENN